MNIRDEAVEAAAEALYELDRYGDPAFTAAHYMPDARAALEAAAPYLVAQGWDEAAVTFDLIAEPNAGDLLRITNPYRPAEARK